MDAVSRREPDGWCWTCRTVPCACERHASVKPDAALGQLARIEAKLNRILRALKVDPDTPESA